MLTAEQVQAIRKEVEAALKVASECEKRRDRIGAVESHVKALALLHRLIDHGQQTMHRSVTLLTEVVGQLNLANSEQTDAFDHLKATVETLKDELEHARHGIHGLEARLDTAAINGVPV